MENIILTTVKNTKTIKSMCGFGLSAECLLYSHKIYNTLLLEPIGSLRNLEAKVKFLKLQMKFGEQNGCIYYPSPAAIMGKMKGNQFRRLSGL
jgi:hypothetical protein